MKPNNTKENQIINIFLNTIKNNYSHNFSTFESNYSDLFAHAQQCEDIVFFMESLAFRRIMLEYSRYCYDTWDNGNYKSHTKTIRRRRAFEEVNRIVLDLNLTHPAQTTDRVKKFGTLCGHSIHTFVLNYSQMFLKLEEVRDNFAEAVLRPFQLMVLDRELDKNQPFPQVLMYLGEKDGNHYAVDIDDLSIVKLRKCPRFKKISSN